MEVRPHKQIVVKVDGSRRFTLRNRRFVRELDPRKTRLEDCQPAISTSPTTVAKTGKDKAIRCDTALMEPAIICDGHTTTAHDT